MNLLQDTFILAYGGLHWSPSDVADLPSKDRRWFVEQLMLVKEDEQKQIKGKGH